MNNAFQKSKAAQRGVSLYISFMIMTVLLTIALGTSAILVAQLKIIRGMVDSVVAFHSADSGIERALYALRKEDYNPVAGESPCGVVFDCPSLCNGAFYKIIIRETGEELVVASKGSYKETNRALEINIKQ